MEAESAWHRQPDPVGGLPCWLFNAAGSATPRPLLLYLHGASSRGDDGEHLATGLPRLLATGALELPGVVVVAPQCPRGTEWAKAAACDQLMVLLPTIEGVDAARVYATGMSMGGLGCWMLAARNPSLLAAIVPICGGGQPVYAPLLKALPILFGHARSDVTVPFAETAALVSALKEAGSASVRLREWAEEPGEEDHSWCAGHNCWDAMWSEASTWSWLLAQRRVEAEAEVAAAAVPRQPESQAEHRKAVTARLLEQAQTPAERERAVARRHVARWDAASNKCKRCWMLRANCVCAVLAPIASLSHVRLVALLSHKELGLSTNTARVALACTPRSRLVVAGCCDAENPLGLSEGGVTLDPAKVLVLFPSQDAVDAPELRAELQLSAGVPLTVVVLDATWKRAAALNRRLPKEYRRVKLANLEAADLRSELRKAGGEGCERPKSNAGTCTAYIQLLRELGGAEAAVEALERSLRAAVAAAQAQRGRAEE